MIEIVVHARVISSYHHLINEEIKVQGSPKVAQIVIIEPEYGHRSA